MRHPRLTLAAIAGAAALAACRDGDNLTFESRPPLAGVRYMHAVNDTGRLDIRMVDQLEYSANTIDSAGGIRYRQATRYFPTEAKARQIRVFNYFDRASATVTDVMLDTSIAFEAGKNYTVMLVGSARAARGRPAACAS
jgi:hypothetical protein